MPARIGARTLRPGFRFSELNTLLDLECLASEVLMCKDARSLLAFTFVYLSAFRFTYYLGSTSKITRSRGPRADISVTSRTVFNTRVVCGSN